MTSSEGLRCAWCGEGFTRKGTKGPTPTYCSASHRQRAYEARRQARVAEGVLRQTFNLGLAESLAAFARPKVTSMFSESLAALAQPKVTSMLRGQLAAAAQVQKTSMFSESLAAFAQPKVTSMFSESLAALAQPKVTSMLSESLAAFAQPNTAPVVESYLQRMAEPELQSKFREQVESLAVVGDWDVDADAIEASLIDFADAVIPPLDERNNEAPAELKPALLAASLLTIVIAHPQLREGLGILAADSVKAVRLLLGLIDGLHEASPEFRGFVILLTIAAAAVALRFDDNG